MNIMRSILVGIAVAILLAGSVQADEREVRFQSDGVALVGTLTTPNGVTKSPALLMVPGSGAVDRNGNGDGLNTDLYRQLAQRLAQLGYVTLRYDKRGIGASTLPEKERYKTSLSQLARDAAAAYNYLRQQPQVDPQRVGILGYEDGALIGMALAAELPSPPKVLVCLAPPGRTPAIILRDNLQQRWRSEGMSADKIQRRLSDFDAAIAALYYRLPLPPLHEDVAPYFMLPDRSYLQEFYFENPVARLKAVKIPVLLLYGELDRRVSPKQDGELLYQQARDAGNSKVTLKVLPGTAHAFKASPSGDTQDVLTNPQLPLAPGLVDALKEWLSANL
ncbi:MAG: alpha/beta hydrolase [Armatimonadota bacterium]|nr:alpha/beta hydrolase [bacterium]MDW8320211.1 alpha/beta hydrolase [Armatimonadota bacterium]